MRAREVVEVGETPAQLLGAVVEGDDRVATGPDRSLLVRVAAASGATVVVQLLGGGDRHP